MQPDGTCRTDCGPESGDFIGRLLRHGERAALVWPHTSLSHARLAHAALAVADWLQAQGVGEGSTVALRIGDDTSHLVAMLALIARGSAQLSLAAHDSPAAHAELLRRTGASHVLCDEATHGGASDASTSSGVVQLRWPAWALHGDPAQPAALMQGTAGAVAASLADLDGATRRAAQGCRRARLYLATSGTTGRPALLALTAGQIAAQSMRHPEYAQDRLLRLASMQYNTSRRHRLYALWQGGANVMRPPGPLGVVLEHARRAGVTCLDVSRMHLAELLALPDPRAALAGMRLRPGGAEVPWPLRRLLVERATAALHVRFATTETGAIAMAGPGEHDETAHCGALLPGVQLRVVDSAGLSLPAGSAGRLLVRAPGMAQGYHDDPQLTAARFADGWFDTGDLGCLRDDGRLVVLGRADDMIVLNGINIFPSEIERALESHPAVAAAVAVGVASPVHGHIPVAAVCLHAGTRASAEELREHVRERLGMRAPRRVAVVPELPTNDQGKLLRKEVRRLFEQRLV